jgi:hypothetical protein
VHPRTNRSYFSLKSLKVCKVVTVLVVSAIPIFATSSDKVVVRQNVSKINRQELARRLQAITGWAELAFDSDGALMIGNANPQGGSRSARDLLHRSISGKRVILFEDASSRKDVVFCRVVLGKLDHGPNTEVHVVLIDFADFRQVTGDKQARAAFDVGWAVLHEMDHVMENSEDPHDDVPGDCEDHVNRMRRELGLPIRISYFFSFLPIRGDGNLISRFVRLGFEQENGKRYWLIWDAAVVGGLISDAESARASRDIF